MLYHIWDGRIMEPYDEYFCEGETYCGKTFKPANGGWLTEEQAVKYGHLNICKKCLEDPDLGLYFLRYMDDV